MTQKERREFIRVPFHTRVCLEAGTTVLDRETSLNLSLGGIRIPFSGMPPVAGTACDVALFLEAAGQRLVIRAQGKIAESGQGTLAVRFQELDPDSYACLRGLVLNNSPDPDRAEREFDAHWGIKNPKEMRADSH